MEDNSKSKEFAIQAENIMTAEPFTTRGRRVLDELKIKSISKSEFFEKCGKCENCNNNLKCENYLYVEPFTGFVDKHDVNDSEDNEDFNYELKEEKRMLLNEEVIFKNRIKTLGASLFIISGVSGCGKTTYIQKLKYDFEQGNENEPSYIFHLCDFESCKSTIRFDGEPLYFSDKFKNPLWKFISITTEEIFTILLHNKKDDENKNYCVRLNEYAMIYKKNFITDEYGDEKEYEDFFKILENSNAALMNFCSEISFAKKIILFFETLYSSTSNLLRDSEYIARIIEYVIGLLVRLSFCVSQKENSKHLYVFDNVEYFLNFTDDNREIIPVSTHELHIIYNAICNSIMQITPIISDIRINIESSNENLKYETFYGFLIVCRTPTTKLFKIDQFPLDVTINISNWFSADNIFKKRQLYFKIDQNHTNEYWKAFNSIVWDRSMYKWGLSHIVDKMYNNSKRRIARLLSKALSNLSYTDIKYFNEQWEQAFPNPSEIAVSSELRVRRYMCRNYIFSILIRLVKQEYFDNINLSKDKYENATNSYVRKIVTYLHNKILRDNKRSISFIELTCAILQNPFENNPYRIKIENVAELARILFWMNERRWEINHWNSLIFIEDKNLFTYDEIPMRKRMELVWEEFINSKKTITTFDCKINIEITDTGLLLAKLMPEFEFFSRRFVFDKGPILPYINQKHFLSEEIRFETIYKIIDSVWTNAITCIENSIKNEKTHYTAISGNAPDYKPIYKLSHDKSYLVYKETNNNESPITHSMRIMKQHIGYMRNIVSFMKFNNFNEESIEKLNIKLIEFCKNAIEIIENNKKYFAYTQNPPSQSYAFIVYLKKS